MDFSLTLIILLLFPELDTTGDEFIGKLIWFCHPGLVGVEPLVDALGMGLDSTFVTFTEDGTFGSLDLGVDGRDFTGRDLYTGGSCLDPADTFVILCCLETLVLDLSLLDSVFDKSTELESASS